MITAALSSYELHMLAFGTVGVVGVCVLTFYAAVKIVDSFVAMDSEDSE
jgi:hypothetical protein